MKKNDFVTLVQEKMVAGGLEKVSKSQIADVIDGISDAIRQVIANNDEVRFGAVGTFSGIVKPARVARNPMTGETVNVAERSGYPKFKFSKTTKDDSKD